MVERNVPFIKPMNCVDSQPLFEKNIILSLEQAGDLFCQLVFEKIFLSYIYADI